MQATATIYTKSAAAKILGIASASLVTVQEWASVVWVWVKGQRPRFMSKKLFKGAFVDSRKSAAAGLLVRQKALTRFEVTNPQSGSRYEVITEAAAVTCTCQDYANQIAVMRRGVCKHGYSTLAYLGHDSLASYLASRSAIVGRPAPTTIKTGRFAGVTLD